MRKGHPNDFIFMQFSETNDEIVGWRARLRAGAHPGKPWVALRAVSVSASVAVSVVNITDVIS